MRENRRLLTVLQIICAVFLVLFLICSILCGTIAAMFNTDAVQRRLEKDGIYEFAMQEIESNLDDLQGVIAIDTEKLMQVITPETVKALLSAHIRASTESLFEGKEDTTSAAFTDDNLYALVCEAITKEQYNGNLTQMVEDRNTAYAELTAAVEKTVFFFPKTLYTSVNDILKDAGVSTGLVFFALDMLKTILLPTVIVLTLLATAGVFFCAKDKQRGALCVAGCTFITSSVFFLISVFMRDFSLIGRLSLGDGVLRRYILAVVNHFGDAFSVSVTVPFIIGTLLLVGAITWQILVQRKNPCKEQETVIE